MLKIAIAEASLTGGTKLRQVAEALVNEAAAGNVAAIKEIADRLDGKVPQGVEGDADNPVHVIQEIIRKVVHVNAGEAAE